jgi:two-component system KDP operon response regulator KdpE
VQQPEGRVLIVEDDSALRRSLRATLELTGFDIGEAGNGSDAFLRLRMVDYDAVLLDINMPGLGGMETCVGIRRIFPRLPILMLTVRDSEDDKVRTLESGADDFLTKPFNIRELVARIRTAIRSYRAPYEPIETPLTVGDITLDPIRRSAELAGAGIHLTPHEFEALRLLMSQPGRPVTHARFHSVLHPSTQVENRAYLRVLIKQLRKKLGDSAENPKYILTDGYLGYRFRDR